MARQIRHDYFRYASAHIRLRFVERGDLQCIVIRELVHSIIGSCVGAGGWESQSRIIGGKVAQMQVDIIVWAVFALMRKLPMLVSRVNYTPRRICIYIGSTCSASKCPHGIYAV